MNSMRRRLMLMLALILLFFSLLALSGCGMKAASR